MIGALAISVIYVMAVSYTHLDVYKRQLIGDFDYAVWANRKTTALRLRFLERLPHAGGGDYG